jgi:hypothetical protein
MPRLVKVLIYPHLPSVLYLSMSPPNVGLYERFAFRIWSLLLGIGSPTGEAAGLEGYWGVAELYPQPSGNQRVELKLNNFEEPEPNSYYELWFVSGAERISAGSFTSVGKGEIRSTGLATLREQGTALS